MTTTKELIELDKARAAIKTAIADLRVQNNSMAANELLEASATFNARIEALSAEVERLKADYERHTNALMHDKAMLQAENDQLRAQLEARGEAVGTLSVWFHKGHLRNSNFEETGCLPAGEYTLYPHPAPAAPVVTEEDFFALQYCREQLRTIVSGKVFRSDESHFQDFRAATIRDASRMAAAALKRVDPVFSRLMDAALHPTQPKGEQTTPEALRFQAITQATHDAHHAAQRFIKTIHDADK